MDYNFLSPYVRCAMHSVLKYPFMIGERIIFDYELIFVSDGACRLEINGKKYICKKNDAIFIRPGVEHKLTGINHTDFTQPHVHFDMCADKNSDKVYVCFEKYSKLSENDKKLVRTDIADIDIPAVFKPSNPQYLQAQLFELIEIFSAKNEFYQLLCKEKMLNILHTVFSQFLSSKTAHHNTNQLQMMNIKSFIDGNYSQKITLDMLSKMFWINKFYIDTNFKKIFGIPVIKYLNQVRFENACRLLKNGTRVGETADLIGFDNIYAFSRFFKNISGKAPSEFINDSK